MNTDQTNSRTWAKLLYRTPENQPYDVAVLRVNPQDMDPLLKSIRLSRAAIVKGKYFFSFFSIAFIFKDSTYIIYNNFDHFALLSRTFRTTG